MALFLNKLEFPSHKDSLSRVWLKLAQWFLRRRFFYFVNVFSLFRIYLSLQKGVTLHFNKLEFSSPKGYFVPRLFEIRPVVLMKFIFKFHQFLFRYFVIISPWKRPRSFILKEKLEFPSPIDALFQVLLKLAQWFWRNFFF